MNINCKVNNNVDNKKFCLRLKRSFSFHVGYGVFVNYVNPIYFLYFRLVIKSFSQINLVIFAPLGREKSPPKPCVLFLIDSLKIIKIPLNKTLPCSIDIAPKQSSHESNLCKSRYSSVA